VFPLSADVTIASFFLSFAFILRASISIKRSYFLFYRKIILASVICR
jgi:hypothetical protein